MAFNTNVFLYLFLPFFIIGYYTLNKLFRSQVVNNVFIIISSLFFYFWGAEKYIIVFVLSGVFNFYYGRYLASKGTKITLRIGILLNILLLFYFKYYNFFAEILHNFGFVFSDFKVVGSPLGISFFTFIAISYLIENYRRVITPGKITDYGTYFTLFPHLIAGPIIRYSEYKFMKADVDDVFEGLWRFILGLSKKVILAGNLEIVANKVFQTPPNELSMTVAWIGALCYTLQIFLDFSGYTDMAIGLAKMIGFEFPENFDNPYRAKTIADFWRRWHMTLTRWFRDFIYIPLGGNRKGEVRTYFNIFLVFFLTGLWHGASWTFIVWGIYHGILQILERLFKIRAGTLLTFISVLIGWVIFRSESIVQAAGYIRTMFYLDTPTASYYKLSYYLESDKIFFLVISLIFVFLNLKVSVRPKTETILKVGTSLLLLLYSAAVMSKISFTPFIYFNF